MQSLRHTRRSSGARDAAEVMLVCSAGGHLMQLFLLREAWSGRRTIWVTHDKDDARSLLEGENVVFAHGPTTRNVRNLVRNLFLAWKLVREIRPEAVVTTGAGVAVPFAWIARLLGSRVIYVESLTRLDGPSLSYRLVRPAAHRAYVQWPELADKLGGAVYVGSVLD